MTTCTLLRPHAPHIETAARRIARPDIPPMTPQETAWMDGGESPMDRASARALTDAINSASDALHALIARAWVRQAWRALGYSSFAAYVDAEFHISRSRAYQFLDQERVNMVIAAAAPPGAPIPTISEAAARDIKHHLGEVSRTIRERTAAASADEIADIVTQTIQEYRARRHGAPSTHPRHPGASSGAEPVRANIAPSHHVRVTMSLFASLSALTSLPEPHEVVLALPESRRQQLPEMLSASIAWLEALQQAWRDHAL